MQKLAPNYEEGKQGGGDAGRKEDVAQREKVLAEGEKAQRNESPRAKRTRRESRHRELFRAGALSSIRPVPRR